MISTLSEDLLNAICHAFQLGHSLSAPSICHGGLVHQAWRIETSTGCYLVKKLNSKVLERTESKERFRITERIAGKLQHVVPAITALTQQEDSLFDYENMTFMVFPYVDAAILAQDAITSHHAAEMGRALACIHQENLTLADAPAIELFRAPELFSSEYKEKIAACCPDVLDLFNRLLPIAKIIAENCQRFESTYQTHLIISHRDCDPKNVLWHANDFYIIDWEAAGWINQTLDTLSIAIYWSLKSDYKIDLDRFKCFLSAYLQQGGSIHADEIDACFYGFLGIWLGWLDFNLVRIMHNPKASEEFILGRSESINTMTAMPIVYEQLIKQMLREKIKSWM